MMMMMIACVCLYLCVCVSVCARAGGRQDGVADGAHRVDGRGAGQARNPDEQNGPGANGARYGARGGAHRSHCTYVIASATSSYEPRVILGFADTLTAYRGLQ